MNKAAAIAHPRGVAMRACRAWRTESIVGVGVVVGGLCKRKERMKDGRAQQKEKRIAACRASLERRFVISLASLWGKLRG
jgi:hypothetical protein